jgi:hypothetical protein
MINFVRHAFDFPIEVQFDRRATCNDDASVWVILLMDSADPLFNISERPNFPEIMSTIGQKNSDLYYSLTEFYRKQYAAR